MKYNQPNQPIIEANAVTLRELRARIHETFKHRDESRAACGLAGLPRPMAAARESHPPMGVAAYEKAEIEHEALSTQLS